MVPAKESASAIQLGHHELVKGSQSQLGQVNGGSAMPGLF